MGKKIFIGLFSFLVLFLITASFQKNEFSYERHGKIKAPPEKIFPYLSQFKLGEQWSPYEKGIEMPRKFSEDDGIIGSWMEFGPGPSGSGRLEITEIVPNEKVQLNLRMTSPFEAFNVVTYRLTPVNEGTQFTWTMEGKNNFIGKIMTLLIDCEKMIGNQFNQGIDNLKSITEKANP